jgi:histidinol-phosphate aminotransferase
MERRTFLRTGVAAGLLGAGGTAVAPNLFGSTRPSRLNRLFRSAPNGPVRLSSNENPLGISPAAREAIIDALTVANRYPGTTSREIVEVLAQKHEVRPDNIVLGAGSTEVLQMTVQAMAKPGVQLIVPDPTFEDVPRYAGPFELPVEKVPLLPDLSHDLDRMSALAKRTSGPVFVYVCNPNNPTGTVTPSAPVEEWIAAAPERVWFVVDEAYYEFAEKAPGYRSALPLIETHRNVIVVRTFSKIHGMAGIRLGYGLAHADTIAEVRKYRSSNSANQLVLHAARASLADKEFQARSLEVNHRGIQVAHGVLDELGLEYLPSHTNFLMHRISGDLRTYIDRMRERGIQVGRPFPPMLTYNRLSIGLPDEMAIWAEALRGFRKKGWV